MKQVTRYKCDYCEKIYASKYRTRDHEKICFFNPASKSCVTCKNKNIKEILDSEGYPVNAIDWCFKMNREIFRKYSPVRHCAGWELKESEVEEE